MPNHCGNHLKVVGSPEEVLRFISTVTKSEDGKETVRILDSIVPCPVELRETTAGWHADEDKQKDLEAQQASNIAKYGHKDWYEWCIANWGTKWGDYNTFQTHVWVSPDKTTMSVTYAFDTAWSPAIDGVEKVSAWFPSLWFINTFLEEGMGFLGVAIMHCGETVSTLEGGLPDADPALDPEDAFEAAAEAAVAHLEQMEQMEIRARVPKELQYAALVA